MASTSTTNNIQIGKSPITNPAPQSSPSPSPSANNQVSNAAQTPTRTPRRPSLGKGSRANSPVKNVHMVCSFFSYSRQLGDLFSFFFRIPFKSYYPSTKKLLGINQTL